MYETSARQKSLYIYELAVMQMTRLIKNVIIVFSALYLLTGCFGLFDSSSDKIIGQYIVIWIDLPKNQMLAKQDELHSSNSSTIIPAYVFAVGHDDNYIIAKQHPTNGFEGGYKIHADTTNYYIIDIIIVRQKSGLKML